MHEEQTESIHSEDGLIFCVGVSSWPVTVLWLLKTKDSSEGMVKFLMNVFCIGMLLGKLADVDRLV